MLDFSAVRLFEFARCSEIIDVVMVGYVGGFLGQQVIDARHRALFPLDEPWRHPLRLADRLARVREEIVM